MLNAARYEAISGSPKHFACYELESPEVYSSETFQHYLANPGEWSKRMSPRVIGQNYVHNVYEVIYPEEVPASMRGGGHGTGDPVRTDGHTGAVRGGVQRLVQHGVCAELLRGAGSDTSADG